MEQRHDQPGATEFRQPVRHDETGIGILVRPIRRHVDNGLPFFEKPAERWVDCLTAFRHIEIPCFQQGNAIDTIGNPYGALRAFHQIANAFEDSVRQTDTAAAR